MLSPKKTKHDYIVVSVGGSLIAPDTLDTQFLHSFRTLIEKKISEGFSFYIICGGGKTARNYQNGAKEAGKDLSRNDLDWLGIHATRLNAHLIRTLFENYARPQVIKNPTKPIVSKYQVMIGAGWKPGWSTDYCAVLAAKNIKAHKLVNLSNIDYVYDSNPKENPEAKKIERLNWTAFRSLIPSEWDPGLSSPFDPVAAKEAQKLNLEVAIINGSKLEEFEKYLDGKEFIGSTIKN
jgi:uridylate kinase